MINGITIVQSTCMQTLSVSVTFVRIASMSKEMASADTNCFGFPPLPRPLSRGNRISADVRWKVEGEKLSRYCLMSKSYRKNNNK